MILAAPVHAGLPSPTAPAPLQGGPLNDQIVNLLAVNCENLLGTDDPDDPANLGENLRRACRTPGTDTGTSVGASGATQTSAILAAAVIAERLAGARGEEEDLGGASADMDIGGGLSLFFSGEYEDREKDRTGFQDRYDSDNVTLTVGADYPVSDKVLGGIAFSYKNEDGNFKNVGGGFDHDNYGVFLYGSLTPVQGFFADIVVGYTYRDLEVKRKPFYEIATLLPGDNRPPLSGTAKSDDADADEFTAGLLLGYDYPIGRYTLGPRAGMRLKRTDFDSYKEKGNSGLELRYDSHKVNEVQSVLGLFGSAAIPTGYAVLVPQISVDYIHEFEDDRESINARFVEDLRPNAKTFTFETDDAQSNWFEVGAGLVAIFPQNFQGFANFRAYAMNGLYDSWVVSAGLRHTF